MIREELEKRPLKNYIYFFQEGAESYIDNFVEMLKKRDVFLEKMNDMKTEEIKEKLKKDHELLMVYIRDTGRPSQRFNTSQEFFSKELEKRGIHHNFSIAVIEVFDISGTEGLESFEIEGEGVKVNKIFYFFVTRDGGFETNTLLNDLYIEYMKNESGKPTFDTLLNHVKEYRGKNKK